MNKQRVVVIGGSSGMGLATATLLAKQGYEIVIASRSQEKLDKAKKDIGCNETYALDITDESQIKNFFSSIQPFNHLVLSAAEFVSGPFLELNLNEARRFFDSKFWGQYCSAKYGASKIQTGGSITFFSGVASQKPLQNLSVASSINGAIEALTRALAFELAPLRVNAVSPGIIVTPIWDDVPEKERLEFFKQTAQKLPARKIGQSEDVAEVVKFLIECGFMTGEVVYCDGGNRLV